MGIITAKQDDLQKAERPVLPLSPEGEEEYTAVSAKADYSGIFEKKKKRERVNQYRGRVWGAHARSSSRR